MTDDYEINSDEDLKELVRGLTNYANHQEELPDSVLESQIRVAKLRLKNKTDSSDFYNDDGLSQALLGTTCVLSKCAAENYSVDRWELGATNIEVREAGDAEQIQFEQWDQLVAEGLRASDKNTTGPLPNVTKSYIG